MVLNKDISEIGKYHPGLSIDCVIFGFHNGELKVLLNKFRFLPKWMLPGGFVGTNEDVDDAAIRILQDRTGLGEVYLKQFHLFGACNRDDMELKMKFIKPQMRKNEYKRHWFFQRFVSLGYLAMVDFSKVILNADPEVEECNWFYIHDVPELCSDHNLIIQKAISTLRMQVGYLPIGYELLPEKFLMSDLRVLYETILDHSLDRRNFQRKMLQSGLIRQLDEQFTDGAFKPANLYSFNKESYQKAMTEGLPFWR